MKEFFESIGKIYKQFILIDIFSFVLPGTIFILTLIYINDAKAHILSLYNDFKILFFIVGYGLAYLAGFAIQSGGVFIGLLKFYQRPKEKSSAKEPRFQSHYKELQEFYESVSGKNCHDYILGWSEKFITLELSS